MGIRVIQSVKDSGLFLGHLLGTSKIVALTILASFSLGFLFAFVHGDSWKLTTFLTFADQMQNIARAQPNVFTGILLNNLKAILTMQLFGLFIIFPAIIVFTNGYILGLFTDLTLRSSHVMAVGNLMPIFLASLIPHAVIELPAFLLTGMTATLLGLKLFFTRAVEPALTRRVFLQKMGAVFVFCFVPLFVAAAFIESYITPAVAGVAQGIFYRRDTAAALPADFLIAKREVDDSALDEEQATEMPASLQWVIKLWGVFVYDRNIRAMLMQTHAVRSGSVNYRFSDGSVLWGHVAEFPSSDQAGTYKKAYLNSLTVLADKDQQITFKELGSAWRFTSGNDELRGVADTVGMYSFVFWYQGNDATAVERVRSLERQKLAPHVR